MRAHATALLAAVLLIGACGGGDGGGGGPIGPGPGTQNGSVRGLVRDQNNSAVPNANVELRAAGAASRTTITDGEGSYSFSAVAPGSYTIAVTPPTGFQLGSSTGLAAVTVVGGQQANVTTMVLQKDAGGGPAPSSVEVRMVNTTFSPASVEVARGGTVTFRNDDLVVHNATGQSVNTGNLNPGQSSNQQMNNLGTFNYICNLHSGMSGTIIVR